MWSFLLANWRELLPTPWSPIVLALVAVACGALVGAERQRQEKPAGLRTLILVCLGAAVFTLVSFAFTTTTGDSGRVAAQIVTGIGFLGAGAILHAGASVTGMTTAATIWMTAAIGMTVGAGYAGAGLGLSLLVRGVLGGIRLWEDYDLSRLPPTTVELLLEPDSGKTRIRVEQILAEFHVYQPPAESADTPDGLRPVRLTFRLLPHHRCALLDALAALPEVRAIHERTDRPNGR
jgi:putative Mg2+ transporter-C (MgtC) family protein